MKEDFSQKAGAALVIVLALVVLLTGLVVAYFSRVTSQRTVASTTFGNVSADIMARSGVDIVVADFKQEIVAGSNAPIGNPPYYAPSANANVVPRRNVAQASQPQLPNLIRVSLRNDSIAAPAIPSRASSVNSAGDPAVDGRVVSPSRWNKHCLLTMNDPATADTDPLPVTQFPAPDWVFLTDQGESVSPPPSAVIGRFAYAVYDEGGLLDMNVAGQPSPTPPNAVVGRKGNLAFADMRALPVAGSSATINAVAQIVGWRNNATLQATPSSSWPTWPAIGSTGQTNFQNLFLGTNQSFLFPATGLYGGRTDQAFLGRKELLNFNGFQGNSGFDANSLGSVGTFSREKNVPTYWLATTSAPPTPLLRRFVIGDLTSLTQTKFGLIPVSPNRWRYVGMSGSTALSAIPAPSATNADFFQMLQFARSTSSTVPPIAETLAIGAAIIDQYDTDASTTEIEYGPPVGGIYPIAYGMEASDPARPTPAPTPPSPYPMWNQPLRTTGEFGYAFSPSSTGRTLNFATASTDAPILDLFTYNAAPLRAGQVNLNTQNEKVIAAIIRIAWLNTTGTSVVGGPAAASAATLFVNASRNQPAMGRQDIPRLAAAVGNTLGSSDEAKEGLARALAEVTTTRTWGLLVDVIAQSGRVRPGSSNLADFVVAGEKRYWLHIAIDRFTGEVLDQQLEAVYE